MRISNIQYLICHFERNCFCRYKWRSVCNPLTFNLIIIRTYLSRYATIVASYVFQYFYLMYPYYIFYLWLLFLFATLCCWNTWISLLGIYKGLSYLIVSFWLYSYLLSYVAVIPTFQEEHLSLSYLILGLQYHSSAYQRTNRIDDTFWHHTSNL